MTTGQTKGILPLGAEANGNKAESKKVSASFYEGYPRATHEMGIILRLDTNVFVRHQFSIEHLNSLGALDELFSGFRVIVPEVVMKECEQRFHEMAAKLNGTRPPELKECLDRIQRTIGNLLEGHFTAWRAKLGQVAEIVPTSDQVLRAAFNRLLDKKPPCHHRDETRDAIIWETVLTTTAPHHRTAMKVFITDNTKDFPFDSNTQLQNEARNSGVHWFKTFADLQQWLAPLRPSRWEEGVDFETWYEQQDFSWYTTGRLQDELPEYLLREFDYFDYDAEVYELSLTDWKIISRSELGDALHEIVVAEKWEICISYSVSADMHIGGSDGFDEVVSGWRQSAGLAEIRRTLKFDQQKRLVVNESEVRNIEFYESEDDWDPHQAWLDSLATDHDDA